MIQSQGIITRDNLYAAIDQTTLRKVVPNGEGAVPAAR